MLGRLRWRKRPGEEPPEATAAPAADLVGSLVREGRLVRLRAHVPANRAAFQRWYGDPEIASLLRHDQEPLSAAQAKSYFETFILPLSARGLCYAIHEAATDHLIGTTALTDVTTRTPGRRSALFRIVIGEKDVWDRGYGTEATRLVMAEAFAGHDFTEIRLEVFRHNPRAIAAYRRVGFRVTGEHVEWVGRPRRELNVVEMTLRRAVFGDGEADDVATAADDLSDGYEPAESAAGSGTGSSRRLRRAARLAARQERRRRREEWRRQRDAWRQDRARRRAAAGRTPPRPAAPVAELTPDTARLLATSPAPGDDEAAARPPRSS